MLKAAPTDEIRQKIEGYLAHRRGIQNKLPIDHPYRENPPVVTTPVLPAWVTKYWSGNDLTTGLIDSWLDRVSGLVLTASGAERPTVATDGGGFKHALFNGTSTRMEALLSSPQPNTIVIFSSNPGNSRYLCDGGTASGRNALYNASTFAGFAGTQRSISISATAKHVFAGVFDNTGQSRLRSTGGVSNVASMGTQPITTFVLGDRFGPINVDHHDGPIYAVVLGEGYAATTEELEELVTYLVSEHGAEAT